MKKNPQRSILMTGCSSGIGLCAAQILAQRGWRVFATARKPADVEMLAAQGLESLQLDLASSESVNHAVDEVLGRTGGTLDALFNNGAYGQIGAVEDLSRDVLREQFETNLFGTHELTTRCIAVMRRQGHGRIVQNSSVLGFVALKYRGAYNATKYALEGLSDTLRLELRGTNIHVVLIEPGPITSRFRDNSYRAFVRNIDIEHSVFRDAYKRMATRLQTTGPVVRFTLPPEAVVDKLLVALDARHPKPRYYVTFPTYLFGCLKRLLSQRLLDRLLAKI